MHPPLTKLLYGLAGWFVGFDGRFKFESIGDNYSEAHVPYVGMRSLPAIMGSLTVPLVYAIMKESGYSTVVAAFSACLILFGRSANYTSQLCLTLAADNAHVAQSRLILLDAPLIFFLTLTIYSYVRFRKLRYREFSPEWWGWLLATGTFMACTWASKVNGILTVVTIGIAVLIELWDILDIEKGHSMVRVTPCYVAKADYPQEFFWKHFIARTIGLIVLPILLYLWFFWVHFAILTHSGPGDSFMSPAFQETLRDNEMLLHSHGNVLGVSPGEFMLTYRSPEIRYYDTIAMRHKETRAFLHSHPERYPLKYDDGRISSQGMVVMKLGIGHYVN